MQIDIRAHDLLLTPGLRAHVRRRLQFTLSRFQDHVSRVTVRLSDINGARGAADKQCHIQLHLHGLPEMVIKDTEVDLYVAVDRAAERTGRSLGRYLQRTSGNFGKPSRWSDDDRTG